MGINYYKIKPGDRVVVVDGTAPGADSLAFEVAERLRALGRPVESERHPADWKTFGRRAGFVRNEEMVNRGADVVLAFISPCSKSGCTKPQPQPHGSHGATITADLAEQAGLAVKRFTS